MESNIHQAFARGINLSRHSGGGRNPVTSFTCPHPTLPRKRGRGILACARMTVVVTARYLPVNFGLRFSPKARTPSSRSSVTTVRL
jgi:hypothetical protein